MSDHLLAEGVKKQRLNDAVQASGVDALRLVDRDNIDMVNCIGGLEFFQADELDEFLTNAYRATRKGGVLNATFELIGSKKPRGNVQRTMNEVVNAVLDHGFNVHAATDIDDAWLLKTKSGVRKPIANGVITAYVP